MPIRPGESSESASERLEHLLDASFAGWGERGSPGAGVS